jgi:hypothetical protein
VITQTDKKAALERVTRPISHPLALRTQSYLAGDPHIEEITRDTNGIKLVRLGGYPFEPRLPEMKISDMEYLHSTTIP